MNIVAETSKVETSGAKGRSIWLLKVPLDLRPLLAEVFAGADVSFPSIRHPDGSFTDTIPAPLLKRMLTEKPAFLALWHDLRVAPDDAEALQAQGVQMFRLDHGRLWGPVPDTPYTPRSYGLRVTDAPPDLLGGHIAAAESAALLERYRELDLTAITEAGPVALPVQAKQLLRSRSVMVVAEDDHGQPTTLADLRAWLALIVRAKAENPGQTVTFLTNGRIPPNPADPAQATVLSSICAQADIVCSERWNRAFLPKCKALYTRAALAAFDTVLADLRSVVTQPGPLQDLTLGKRTAPDVLAELYLTDMVFGDPVHGRVIPRALVFDLIAARRDLMDPAPLPASLRWPAAQDKTEQPGAPLPGFAGKTASYDAIDPAKTLTAPHALLAPDWLAPALGPQLAGGGSVLMLAGDRRNIAAFQDSGAWVTDLALHPQGNLDAVESFAHYQPALYLDVVRRAVRKSGLRKALVCDISALSVRLFARACAMEGIERAYLPVQIDPPAALASVRSLADLAFLWDPAQSDSLSRAGRMAADRLIPVRLPQPAQPREAIVIWLGQTGLSLSRLKAAISDVLSVAELMERRVEFALGREALEKLDPPTFERIAFHELAGFTVVGDHDASPAELVSRAALVVTSETRTRALADQLACPHVPLVPPVHPEQDLTSEALRAHLHATLLAWFDTAMDQPAAPSPQFRDAPDIHAALADWSKAAPLPRKTVFRPEDVCWAIGTVSESTLRNQSRYMIPALGLGAYSEVVFENAPHDFPDADVLFQWGLRVTKHKSRADLTARGLNIPVVNLEDGFIRSIGIGLSGETSISVCFDDRTAFYDATMPSQLELWINQGVPLTQSEHTRARAVIDRIAAQKVTKYNFAPYVPIALRDPARKAILVVDQRAGDVSIEKGLASPETFAQMVDAALAFADTHDILIKTHPDANIGGKDSAFGGETLARAAKHPAVTLVTEDMNPYSLIDIVEKVFVVSSGMGFEALLAGREVWCFGAPFYAGWGLTRDHVDLPRRTACPTLEAVFHAFYIEHTRYFDPVADAPGQIEAAIEYILMQRPWSLARCQAAVPRVLGERPARDARVTTVSAGIDQAWCLGFPVGYAAWLKRNMPDAPQATRFDETVITAMSDPRRAGFMVYAGTSQPGLQALATRRGIPVIQAQPGVARWSGPAGLDAQPYTLCLDRSGLFQDGTRPSDLEHLLLTHDFDADAGLLDRARALRPRVAALGLSDGYRLGRWPQPYGPKQARRVLIVGGGAAVADLVGLARRENPDAQIICHMPSRAAPPQLGGAADVWTQPLCPEDMFDGVDQVYTQAGDAGFEALLRGIDVTTTGTPFYAGWGLTDDRSPVARRGRALSPEALVAGALLLYPLYLDPASGASLQAEDIVARLERMQEVMRLAAL